MTRIDAANFHDLDLLAVLRRSEELAVDNAHGLSPRILAVADAIRTGPSRATLGIGAMITPNPASRTLGRMLALTQFVGACDTLLAATQSLRSGYPHVVPTLVRRAFEASAVALHFTQTAAGREAIAAYQASKTKLHPPDIGRAVGCVYDAMRARKADAEAVKLFYKSLSDDAHTAPGVMIQTHFDSLETGRFGPQSASVDPNGFAKASSAIEMGSGMVHECVGFAFPEFA